MMSWWKAITNFATHKPFFDFSDNNVEYIKQLPRQSSEELLKQHFILPKIDKVVEQQPENKAG